MRKWFLSPWLLVCTIAFSQNNSYYVDNQMGRDNNPGTLASPWKSVSATNKFNFEPGDQLFFKGGQTFGVLQLQNNDAGLTIKSYSGVATLGGMYAYNVGNITIDGINFYGPGTTVNTTDGIFFYMDSQAPGDLSNLVFRNINVSNFGGSGLDIGAWNTNNGYNNVEVSNSTFYGNGFGGLSTYGYNDVVNHTNLHIFNVKAYQNYGRLDINYTHTGSGITIGGFNGGVIENCEAYENGKNNRNTSTNHGGPQGVWCYNSSHLTIQNCISHDNRAGLYNDGSGFDIDGGSQYCTIQYCYSYNNDGPGFAFFEHGSTNQFTNNIIRYNISQRDARRNKEGGLMMWAHDTLNRIKNSQFYNNTVYVTPSSTSPSGYPVGMYFLGSNFKNNLFYNNIIYTVDTVNIFKGSTTGMTFSNNDYYSSGETANFNKGGITKDPLFVNAGGGKSGYVLRGLSPAIDAGKANDMTKDIIGTTVPQNGLYDIGAYESFLKPPVANAGADKTITLPTNSVTLNASGSSDPDGTITKYNWTKVSGSSTYLINTPNAASTTVSNLVQGTYTFRVTVTDNDGISRYDDVIVYVNAAIPSGIKLVRVNLYGGSNAYTNSAWNNWNVSSSKTITSLKYFDGTTSTVGAVISASSGISDNGSSYGGTMAPPEVLRYTSYSGSLRTLTISGLSTTKTYNLSLYASRNTTGNSTIFTVGSKSITIVTDNNKTNAATFTGLVPNSSGQIVVSVNKVGTYNFLNGFTLTANSSTASTTSTPVNAAVVEAIEGGLQVQAYPNPAENHFTLRVSGGTQQPIQLHITNELGSTIEVKQLALDHTAVFGDSYKPGVYFAEVVQGNRRAILKLVKQGSK